jgi:hypothetical protein
MDAMLSMEGLQGEPEEEDDDEELYLLLICDLFEESV